MTGISIPDAGSPGCRLEEIYRRIHREQMFGLPILNPALEVEATGFMPYLGHRLGILITPWFMKLMLLPGAAPWPEVPEGESQSWPFPCGALKFIAERDEQGGPYQAFSLFSPMREFADQDEARAAARAVLEGLFIEAVPAGAAPPAPAPAGPLENICEAVAAPMSKRDFLRGSFLGRLRESGR